MNSRKFPEVLSRAVPNPLVIEPEHHDIGQETYRLVCKANGKDKGTRGLDYAGDTDRHKKAALGYVIESAFLAGMGVDPWPRVNPKGRDDEPDLVLDGVAYDVKGTSTSFPFVARVKVRKHRDWVFVNYTFKGELLAIATGEEYVQHGEVCTKDDLWRTPRSNIKLPVGYGT